MTTPDHARTDAVDTTSERPVGSRSVLVTGSTRGIGRAVAEAFARLGDRVVVHGRDDVVASRVAADLPEAHAPHVGLGADLDDAAAVERLAARAIAAADGIDVLVNNAGIYVDHDPLHAPLDAWREAWRRTLQVNLLAAADLCVLVARDLAARGRGGAIVQVGSRGAFRGEPGHPAYGASKAGLHHLGQSLAVALAPHGIRVIAVAPGFVETDMTEAILAGPEGAAIRAQSPLGRAGRPEEIARAVVLLADPEIAFSTGAILDANGASYLRA